MRVTQLFAIAAVCISLAPKSNATSTEQVRKTVEISAIEARAIAVAFKEFESLGVALDNYVVEVSNEEKNITVTFVDKDRPSGFRGSRPGLPQPIVTVNTHTGEIVNKVFIR